MKSMNGFPIHHAIFPACTYPAEWAIDPMAIDRFAVEHAGLTPRRLMEMIDGVEIRYRPPAYHCARDVAVVPIAGPLFKYPAGEQIIAGGSAMVDLASVIDRAAADESVRGIVLTFNSPGGMVPGRSLILEAIERARHQDKPVAGFIDGECGGVAYSIAARTRPLFSSVSGSVGHVSSISWNPDWIGRSAAALDGQGLLFWGQDPADLPDEQIDLLDRMGRELVREISAARELNPNRLQRVAGERVQSAEQAEALDLIDELLSGLDVALDRMHRGDLR